MGILYKNIKKLILKSLYIIVFTTSFLIPILLFIQVIYRYIFKRPIPGVEELASAAFIWMIIFGLPILYSCGNHIIVDVFVKNRTKRIKTKIEIINNIITILILIVLIYSCYIAIPNQTAYKTIVFRIPRVAHTIALIVSFVLMVLQSIENLLLKIKENGTNAC